MPAAAWSLLSEDVVHLDPREAVWTAMCRGWAIQQQARMLSSATVEGRLNAVRRFFEYTGEYPWVWQPVDVEEWSAQLRSNRSAHGTIRGYQNAVALFCDYLVDPRYGWGDLCFERFGSHPIQVCHEWNTARHVSEFEGSPRVRPFSREEVQQLFDFADQQVTRAAAVGRKGAIAAFRDAVLLKTTYAYGLRRQEAVRLDVTDFHRNPKAPELGEFGSCHVRYGKASRGSPPRRRTVLTVFPWIVDVLGQYVTDVRPRYEVGQRRTLWPTERGGAVSTGYLEQRFLQYREAADLPSELRLHSLRHAYVTHLIEDGWDAYFVQRQVGHAWASTTSIYAGVTGDYMNTVLRAALDNRLGDLAPSLDGTTPSEPGAEGERSDR
ncbi:MAG: tyrosine-type recombinase/integrase [Dermatophilaceae bacterium]